jgi:Leucine-rich repeat (LRR) protein
MKHSVYNQQRPQVKQNNRMSFQIEEYLNGLPDDITSLKLSHKNLTYLPDLSRFYNLQELNCNNNELTELPPLNPSLKILHCSNNRLTRLPPLNANLEQLSCGDNQLTHLPSLNSNLQFLFCFDNQLTSLPPLNENLKKIYCFNNQLTHLSPLNPKLQKICFGNNPIYDLVANAKTDRISVDIISVKKKLQILYNFKLLFYSLKFKKQLREWLWVKVREPRIQEYYSPANLQKLLSGIDEQDQEQLDAVLNTW